jgi:hypothetical protein
MCDFDEHTFFVKEVLKIIALALSPFGQIRCSFFIKSAGG